MVWQVLLNPLYNCVALVCVHAVVDRSGKSVTGVAYIVDLRLRRCILTGNEVGVVLRTIPYAALYWCVELCVEPLLLVAQVLPGGHVLFCCLRTAA